MLRTTSTLSVTRGSEAPHPEAPTRQEHTFSVGTRKSRLALAQTEIFVNEAVKHYPKGIFVVKARDTAAGDIDKVTPFKDMPVKNIWTHELEAMLVDKELDILVHSLKDVPTQLPPNCEISGVTIRSDPRDVFVIKAGRTACKIQDLPAGSVIGTSSIRRTAQIALRFPHLVVKDMRGNMETRLRKLDDEDSGFDGLILAAAGLLRIDLGHRITQYLDSKDGDMLHAVGQGAIGIENRERDHACRDIVASVNHLPTFYAVTAERRLLRTIEGGCSAPLGVETTWIDNKNLNFKAIVVSVDGQEYAEYETTEEVSSVDEAERLGQTVAVEILRRGADKILAEIKAKKPTTVADLEDK